jgi:leucyl aminopeptidase
MIARLVVGDAASVGCEWLVVGVGDGDSPLPPGLADGPLAELASRLKSSRELPSAVGETLAIHGACGVAAGAVLLAGTGPRDRFDPAAAFTLGVAVGRKLGSRQRGTVAIALPGGIPLAEAARGLAEGLTVGSSGPGLRKAEPLRFAFREILLVTPSAEPDQIPSVEAALERGRIVGHAVNLARELANTPPADKTPRAVAQRAFDLAREAGIEAVCWDHDRIEQERFGGLLGVAAGSDAPPAFVILRYRNGGNLPPLALVGKGVTFDSGGLSLKPSDSMKDMKADMTGAAVVLATLQAAARLGLKVNLDGYLALTENMTGGRAMKLGDVLTMRSGTTVEVLNTDAEGRLILADALAYAVEQKPARILDLATLTGACVVALGTRIAGLFANDDAFAGELLLACKVTGERAWRMPLDDDFDDALKSSVADLKNIGGRWGGAITAAKFLQRFVANTPWVHLDIAGPSWAESDTAAGDAGGTGCYVRTLIRYLEAQPQA